jgi:LCP family protein required for cell wall assembly
MSTARAARGIAVKVGYTATCLLAAVIVVTSGYAHKAVAELDATGDGIAISGSSYSHTPTAATPATNILVMGLESRTNFEGQPLSSSLITAMHSGPVGGQDPDTLILIHIFAGGQKAVGFSIPRDDLVNFPHPFDVDGISIPDGKIDNAYDWAYNESLAQTGSSTAGDYLKANQAGQTAEIDVVQSITGVTINDFIETNLAGFYYLAQAFGGVEVCLKPQEAGITIDNYMSSNLYDANSGFNAVLDDGYNLKQGGAQYLHLAPDQALAFVRERDNLSEGDIDRTRRQQAVIDYVIWELRHENAFSDLAKLSSLLDAAHEYLITDQGLNLLDFSTEMEALSSQNLTFQTLPSDPGASELLPGLGSAPQSVNIIDVPYLKRLVHDTFYPPPAAAKATSPASPSSADFVEDQSAQAAGAAAPSASPTPSASAAPSAPAAPGAPAGSEDGTGGGSITVAPDAKYGIPCVY